MHPHPVCKLSRVLSQEEDRLAEQRRLKRMSEGAAGTPMSPEEVDALPQLT